MSTNSVNEQGHADQDVDPAHNHHTLLGSQRREAAEGVVAGRINNHPEMSVVLSEILAVEVPAATDGASQISNLSVRTPFRLQIAHLAHNLTTIRSIQTGIKTQQ